MNKIEIYNLSVKFSTNDSLLIYHLNEFIDKYYTVKQKSFGYGNKTDVKQFISRLNGYNVFYLHIYQFLHFKKYLEQISFSASIDEKVDKRDYNIQVADMKVREGWIPRENQIPVIDFLLKNPTRSKLVPLQTGQGKTFISLYALSKLSQRVGIVILPTYIDKWIQDISTIHEASPKDIMVVQGSKSIKAIIELAKENSLENNYIIFSSRTLQEFITNYENDPQGVIDYYGIEPIELFPLLNIGVMLIDETHQHFHAIFKILLHTNVKYQIGLSATLMSDNFVIRKLHSIVYPKNNVYNDHKLDIYTDVYAIGYTISPSNIKFIRTENRGSNSYSHIAFEQSIMRRDYLLSKYFNIICETVESYYLDEYQDKDKLLIFVSTVDMATKLTEYLSIKYSSYLVKRYCEDDPFDHINEADIIVSTIISAGTAVDIKNLRVVIQTIPISSPVANIQSLGRLRKLSDRDTKFCYLYCLNLEKHRRYHLKRLELFRDRVKNIYERNARYAIN